MLVNLDNTFSSIIRVDTGRINMATTSHVIRMFKSNYIDKHYFIMMSVYNFNIVYIYGISFISIDIVRIICAIITLI